MPTHEHFMQRAIELANRAWGNTSPNPPVGAVIVRDNIIIAEGWHKQAGAAHAEVDAIRNAINKGDSTQGATMYVSLEPCSHHGKTPPCTQAILDAGISTLVYATSDTSVKGSGGAKVLRAAGVEVVSGICEEQARYNCRFFLHFQEHTTPFVMAKFASSLDGRTATRTGHSQWITGQAAREHGHLARQQVDAIIVGAQTAIADQPKLTVRNPKAHEYTDAAHPLRIVLDSHGRVPLDNAIFDSALPSQTIVATTSAMPAAHAKKLLDLNVDVISLPKAAGTTYPDITALMQELGKRNIQSVLVEGGHSVIGDFLDKHLIDELWAFMAPTLIGGKDSAPSVGGLGFDRLEQAPQLTNVVVEQLDKDILIRGLVSKPTPNSAKEKFAKGKP